MGTTCYLLEDFKAQLPAEEFGRLVETWKCRKAEEREKCGNEQPFVTVGDIWVKEILPVWDPILRDWQSKRYEAGRVLLGKARAARKRGGHLYPYGQPRR